MIRSMRFIMESAFSKGRNPSPRSYRFGSLALLLVPLLTFWSMVAYQYIKHCFVPEIDIWRSHLHTNVFVTVAVSIAAFLTSKYLEMSSLLASIVESSDDAVVGTTLDGKVLAWNKGAGRIYGYSREEMLGKNLWIIVPADKPNDLSYVLNRIAKGERVEHYETTRIRKDGKRIDVSLSASPILNARGKIIGASTVVRDVTERQRARNALRESQARLARAQAFSLIMVAHLSLEGRWIKVPPALCDTLGYSEEEMRERRFEEVTYPDDFEMEWSHCRDLISGKVKSVELEKRCIARDGEIIWFDCNYSMVQDDEGKPVHFLLYIRNITKRKSAEEEVKRYQLHLEELVETRTRALSEANEHLRSEILERRKAEQSLKESSDKLKFFAYSVIHDLKSPSVGIYGLTRRLHDCYRDVLDTKGKLYCEQILKGTEHVTELIDKINTYIATKETPMMIESIDTKEMFASLRDEFSERFSRNRIDWVEPEADFTIRADRLCILRVLRNFIDNSLKYGGDRLKEIRLDCSESKKFYILSVTDDGGGLETEDLDRIFEVFQRTVSSKGIAGSGLGLAIVKEIAERHKGLVWMEQEAESGKTFSISIAKSL